MFFSFVKNKLYGILTMINLYKKEINIAKNLKNNTDMHIHFTSIYRSLMQTISISLITIIDDLIDEPPQEFSNYISRFYSPSDGLPKEFIDFAIPLISSVTNGNVLGAWFKKNPQKKSLRTLVLEQTEKRNLVTAHGAPNSDFFQTDINSLEDVVNLCLECFKTILPKIDNKTLIIDYPETITINVPLVQDDKCIVINKVKNNKNTFDMKCSVVDWFGNKENQKTINLNQNNIFNLSLYQTRKRFNIFRKKINGKEYEFYTNLPPRQTGTFFGRKKEIEQLKEWIEDEEGRTCLIFGDGGYGKTTLLLEFFNQVIDGELDLKVSIPDIISYHTAKKTQWSENGIKYNTDVSNSIDDGIRELLYCFSDALDKSWFETDGTALINKVQTELQSYGFERKNILIIIDNTETLAKNNNEIDLLGRFLTLVSKKIGRLILTSRRREVLEAHPIQISALSEDDSIDLINALAKKHNAISIIQAGNAKIRKACSQLNFKPLLINALVLYIARTRSSIDDALNHIYKNNDDELLEFLYEDAWQRMDSKQREVFLILASVQCPLDSDSVGLICQNLEIQHSEFVKSFDETYFVNFHDSGYKYEISFVELAKKFFLSKMSKESEQKIVSLNRIAESITTKYVQNKQIEEQYNTDIERVYQAFKCSSAKQAKICVDKNDINGAMDNFEYALIEDPLNAYLHERYAFFLYSNLNEQYRIKALSIINKGLELDNKNPEVLLTAAIINYRLLNILEGDKLIDEAVKYGKSLSYSLQRKSIARFHYLHIKYTELTSNESLFLYDESLNQMKQAAKFIKKNEPYYAKNNRTINQYIKNKLPQLLIKIKADLKRRASINRFK